MLLPNLFTMHLPLMLWRYPGPAKYLKAFAVLSHPVELAAYFSTSVKVNFGKRERSTLGSLGKSNSNQTKLNSHNLRFFAFCRHTTRLQFSAILTYRSSPRPGKGNLAKIE